MIFMISMKHLQATTRLNKIHDIDPLISTALRSSPRPHCYFSCLPSHCTLLGNIQGSPLALHRRTPESSYNKRPNSPSVWGSLGRHVCQMPWSIEHLTQTIEVQLGKQCRRMVLLFDSRSQKGTKREF